MSYPIDSSLSRFFFATDDSSVTLLFHTYPYFVSHMQIYCNTFLKKIQMFTEKNRKKYLFRVFIRKPSTYVHDYFYYKNIEIYNQSRYFRIIPKCLKSAIKKRKRIQKNFVVRFRKNFISCVLCNIRKNKSARAKIPKSKSQFSYLSPASFAYLSYICPFSL